jgi:C4-type Zn-finger protein
MSKLTNDEIHKNYLNHIKETEKTLKPCPFCGKSVTMNETEDGMGYSKELVVRISCDTKDCYTYKDGGLFSPRWSEEPYEKLMNKNCKVVTELAKRWNRRA